MTDHNHRRGRSGQDNGPRYESPDPSAGCNSTHVARGRKKWKRIRARAERRAGSRNGFIGGRQPEPLPDTEGLE